MTSSRQAAYNIRQQTIQIEKELTRGDITLGTAFGRATELLTIAAMNLECMDPSALLDPIVDEMEAIRNAEK